MPITRALGLVCSLLLVACAKDDSPAPAAADRCAEIAAEFRDTLKAATGACTTAADCHR